MTGPYEAPAFGLFLPEEIGMSKPLTKAAVVLAAFATSAAMVFAAGSVIVDGTTAHVRVITQGGVSYVAAPDIAKAFGKSFQIHNGVLVFGAPGGHNKAPVAVTEFGKSAFNGYLRARVISVKSADPACSNTNGLTVDIANASNAPMRFGPSGPPGNVQVNNQFNIFSNGQGVASMTTGDYAITNLNPGDHVTKTLCYRGVIGDFVEVKTAKDLGFGKTQPWPDMKIKLH